MTEQFHVSMCINFNPPIMKIGVELTQNENDIIMRYDDEDNDDDDYDNVDDDDDSDSGE